jgi:hypothetical protein
MPSQMPYMNVALTEHFSILWNWILVLIVQFIQLPHGYSTYVDFYTWLPTINYSLVTLIILQVEVSRHNIMADKGQLVSFVVYQRPVYDTRYICSIHKKKPLKLPPFTTLKN